MDFVARYHKMLWKDRDLFRDSFVYPFCFDCNGVPTEKLAHKQNISGTENIINFAEELSKPYEDLFGKIKMDFEPHRYHTYDTNARILAEQSFQDLVGKGYAYKTTTEFFWCPETKVSVSQAEVDDNGCYERSGAKVEVRTGEGWFINMKDHLPKIRDAIDRIIWKPPVFQERLHRWLDDLKYDWSISRERKYGIPIPGEENMVFDTWFTSSLSPQMSWQSYLDKHTHDLGSWPRGVGPTLDCPVFDVRFQAHDIIRTWALFTIVKSLYHNDQIPWKTIVISGHALDPKGKKISKSAGNFVPPQEYLDKYGSSGVRYWTAQNALGTDTKTDIQAMDKGKKLVNKIKNARKFLAMKNIEGRDTDQWHWHFWKNLEVRLHTHMQAYEWHEAIGWLTTFFWTDFCGEYIESAKEFPNLVKTLNQIMDEILPWFEIFLPGITDATA